MIEYLIDSASIVFLAGCVYAAYLILSGSGARAYRKTDLAARDPADHAARFRQPCADYYS